MPKPRPEPGPRSGEAAWKEGLRGHPRWQSLPQAKLCRTLRCGHRVSAPGDPRARDRGHESEGCAAVAGCGQKADPQSLGSAPPRSAGPLSSGSCAQDTVHSGPGGQHRTTCQHTTEVLTRCVATASGCPSTAPGTLASAMAPVHRRGAHRELGREATRPGEEGQELNPEDTPGRGGGVPRENGRCD